MVRMHTQTKEKHALPSKHSDGTHTLQNPTTINLQHDVPFEDTQEAKPIKRSIDNHSNFINCPLHTSPRPPITDLEQPSRSIFARSILSFILSSTTAASFGLVPQPVPTAPVASMSITSITQPRSTAGSTSPSSRDRNNNSMSSAMPCAPKYRGSGPRSGALAQPSLVWDARFPSRGKRALDRVWLPHAATARWCVQRWVDVYFDLAQ